MQHCAQSAGRRCARQASAFASPSQRVVDANLKRLGHQAELVVFCEQGRQLGLWIPQFDHQAPHLERRRHPEGGGWNGAIFASVVQQDGRFGDGDRIGVARRVVQNVLALGCAPYRRYPSRVGRVNELERVWLHNARFASVGSLLAVVRATVRKVCENDASAPNRWHVGRWAGRRRRRGRRRKRRRWTRWRW